MSLINFVSRLKTNLEKLINVYNVVKKIPEHLAGVPHVHYKILVKNFKLTRCSFLAIDFSIQMHLFGVIAADDYIYHHSKWQ